MLADPHQVTSVLGRWWDDPALTGLHRLPASTWAMMPMLRMSDSGVLRAISRVPKRMKWKGRDLPQDGLSGP